MIASTLALLHCQIVLVFVIELLHGTFQHSVFIPVYSIGYIPIPNIGNNILFLSFKFARLIYTELVVGRTSGCLITPFHIITFHCYNQITVWCSTAVDMACPPGSTSCPDVMLIYTGSRKRVFIKMCMTRKDMNLIRP